MVTILWELTRERSSCDALVQVFKDAGQEDLANKLNDYNTSKGDWPLSLEIELNVTPKTTPDNDSNCYNDLTRNPRGKCVIINNVEAQQYPDIVDRWGQIIFKPKGLRNETLRFQNIFRQLFFDVIVLTEGTNGLTAQEIRRQLTQISKDPTLEKDKAFVLIIISHGQNESVYGSNACEWIKKTMFNKNLEKDREVQNAMEEDSVKIDNLIDIFSVGKCPQLKDKPKLHLFICCRDESQTIGFHFSVN